jgi:hypothetical protein
MYNVGGLEGDALYEARWWALPQWLRVLLLGEEAAPDQRTPCVWRDTPRRCPGGWIDKESGEFFVSPYEVRFIAGGVWLWRKDQGEFPRIP